MHNLKLINKENTWLIVVSLLIGCFIQLTNHDPINVDGILYLETANAYLAGGLRSAIAVYNWPFYPILIAWCYQLTHIDLLTIAFWLNNIFITLAMLSFISILRVLGANRVVMYFGLLTVLCYPAFNQFRSFVIRDVGYWASLLFGFWALLRYQQQPQWTFALLWGVSMLFGTLFRIEGAMVWSLLPLCLLLQPQIAFYDRCKQFIQCNSILLICLLGLSVWIFSKPSHHLLQLGRTNELAQTVKSLFQTVASNFILHRHLLWQSPLGVLLGSDTSIFFVCGMIGVFIINFINALTLPFTLLVLYALLKKIQPSDGYSQYVLRWFTFITIGIPLVFYINSFILTSRYLVPACLALLLWCPFALTVLWQKACMPFAKTRHRYTFYFAILFILATSFGGIFHFGYSKAYIKQAGLWLHSHAHATATIFSNSREVLFYAGRSTIDWQTEDTPAKLLSTLKEDGWKKYNYLAIRVNKNNDNTVQQLITRLPLQPVKTFTNKRHDKVIIFYVAH